MPQDSTETTAASHSLSVARIKLADEMDNILRRNRVELLDARDYLAEIAGTPHVARGRASTAMGDTPEQTDKLRKNEEKPWKSGPGEFPYAVDFGDAAQVRRGKGCVLHAGCIVTVDIDSGLDVATFDALVGRLDQLGAHAVFSTSWSHRRDPEERQYRGRLRVLVDRDVPKVEIQASRLGLGVLLGLQVDHAAAGEYALFFDAACPPERAHLAFHKMWTGVPLSADELVRLGRGVARETKSRTGAKRASTTSTPRPRAPATALGRERAASIMDALRARGADVVQPGRAACPACAPSGHQGSPSFVWSVDGDHIAAHCFADGCSGHAALEALGLDTLWGTGEEQRLKGGALEAELFYAGNVPERMYNLEDAQVEIRAALAAGLLGADGMNLLLWATTGAGKTRLACDAIRQHVESTGGQVVFLAGDHAVLGEVRTQLSSMGLTVSHLASPLRSDIDTGAPKCPLTGPAKKHVLQMLDSGYSGRSVCNTCSQKDGCAARAWKPKPAQVILAWVGDAERALELAHVRASVIVDEHHAQHHYARLTASDLPALVSALRFVSPEQRAVCGALIRWLETGEKPMVVWPPQGLNGESVEPRDAVTVARKFRGQLQTSPVAPMPSVGEREGLSLVRSLLGLFSGDEMPRSYVGDDGVIGWEATTLGPLGEVLAGWERPIIVMSATPMVEAYNPSRWRVVRVDVDDAPGITVERSHIYKGRVTRKALCPDKFVNRENVEREVRELVREDFTPGQPALLATYKAVADALRPDGELYWLMREFADEGYDIVVGHYHGLRGRNFVVGPDGAQVPVMSFKAISTLGDALTGGLDALAADVHDADGIDPDVWRRDAGAEAAQSLGRGRPVRQTHDLKLTHRGAYPVLDWHADQRVVVEVRDARLVSEEERARVQDELRALVEELVDDWGISTRAIAAACGLQGTQGPASVRHWRNGTQGVPEQHRAALRGLRPRRSLVGKVPEARPWALVRPAGMRKRDWDQALARHAARWAWLAAPDAADEEWLESRAAEVANEQHAARERWLEVGGP